MKKGELLGDALVSSIVERGLENAMCKRGFILDGYPRTVQQAILVVILWPSHWVSLSPAARLVDVLPLQLDSILEKRKTPLDAVLELEIKEEKLVQRVEGRLIHPASGRTYHTVGAALIPSQRGLRLYPLHPIQEFNPPKEPMKDDVTGEPLIRRADDNAEVLRKRLLDYRQSVCLPLPSFAVKVAPGGPPSPHSDRTSQELLRRAESAAHGGRGSAHLRSHGQHRGSAQEGAREASQFAAGQGPQCKRSALMVVTMCPSR